MRQIQNLYQIEAELRHRGAGPKLHAAIRQHQSAAIVRRIHRGLSALKLSRRHLPQSSIGKAIDYALGLWPTLTVYLEQGQIEIDNNLVENAIRPTALGKKNWLFFGGAEAGQRGAILYTIIESCRRRGVEPYQYLRDVLTRLPSMTNHQVAQIVPAEWAKERTVVLKAASESAASNTTPLIGSCSYDSTSHNAWGDAYADLCGTGTEMAKERTHQSSSLPLFLALKL